jgi:hypothetical protein
VRLTRSFALQNDCDSPVLAGSPTSPRGYSRFFLCRLHRSITSKDLFAGRHNASGPFRAASTSANGVLIINQQYSAFSL